MYLICILFFFFVCVIELISSRIYIQLFYLFFLLNIFLIALIYTCVLCKVYDTNQFNESFIEHFIKKRIMQTHLFEKRNNNIKKYLGTILLFDNWYSEQKKCIRRVINSADFSFYLKQNYMFLTVFSFNKPSF